MKSSRRSFLSGGVAPVSFVTRAAHADFVYKYAIKLPNTHPMSIRAREMAAIESETDSRFDLQVFPNGQLLSNTDTPSQLRSGGVEFFTLSGLILSTLGEFRTALFDGVGAGSYGAYAIARL